VDSDTNANEIYFTMTDLLGKFIWSSAPQHFVSANKKVLTFDNFSGLNSGIYFLNAYLDGNIVKTVKVVKQE